MAPIRRYLRISKYSALECRIYLDNPSDSRWLLDTRQPVLPRVFSAIRPLVLPKLREENERLSAKKKSKPVKDVIVEDDFEVAVFLRESRTHHSILTRHKIFEEPDAHRSDTLAYKRNASAKRRTDGLGATGDRILVESDGEGRDLRNIPRTAEDASDSSGPSDIAHSERLRRKNKRPLSVAQEDSDEDNKKLRFHTSYESFNIYGWILCLLVTRKDESTKAQAAPPESPRQALMEEWISTQGPGSAEED